MRANERARVGTFRVRKGDENFAKYSSIFLRHNADASYTCRIATVFNRTRLTNGSQSAPASNRRMIPHALSVSVNDARSEECAASQNLLSSHSACGGFKSFKDHGFGQHFWKDDRFFVFSGIEHIQRNAGATKPLQ